MKKKVKPKSAKSGNNKPKTKKINLNESTDHDNAAADGKEETAGDAHGSTPTGNSGSPPESNEPLDENDESESALDHPASGSDGENPPPGGAEPGEQATALEVIDPGGSKLPRKKGKKSGVEIVSAVQDKLSDQERTTLNDCLEVIHQGMDTFVQVGSAIATIIVQKLYRETHPTFERYANEVLGISPRRAYQLRDASDVIDNLKQANNRSHEDGGPADLPLPMNENQVRALKNFSPDAQFEIWREAIKAAGEKKVTGKVLAKVIQAREKTTDASATNDSDKKNAEKDSSAFDDEIEKVIATLNRAWKALPEAQVALRNRVSEWLTSVGEADQAAA